MINFSLIVVKVYFHEDWLQKHLITCGEFPHQSPTLANELLDDQQINTKEDELQVHLKTEPDLVTNNNDTSNDENEILVNDSINGHAILVNDGNGDEMGMRI